MLILQNIAYAHPDKDILFDKLELAINRQDKIALTGNNGSGKSTLLKIMAGKLEVVRGKVIRDTAPYHVPQITGQYDNCTVAEALGVAGKMKALAEILSGHVTEGNMDTLNEDWNVEERCREALQKWGLSELQLTQKLETLSGGQKTKVLLAGISVHKPEMVLLDEPSNHLDTSGRALLYNYTRETPNTLVVVSHDRELLRLLDTVWELNNGKINAYGGNYDHYLEQKAVAMNAQHEDLKSKEKELRKARETERASLERQQKLDARGRKKQDKAGVPTISLNTLRNNAEKSTARLRDAHAEKTGSMAQELVEMRRALPGNDKMKMGFEDTALHKGKILIKADELVWGYNGHAINRQPLSYKICSGDRIAIKGANGSGKTTLVKVMTGALRPIAGKIEVAEAGIIYIDQEYSMLKGKLSVYEQAQEFNAEQLAEHEVKSRLTHFLFTKEYWNKPCETLSGGEKMRLVLCCLGLRQTAPDIIVLDEPTNNLDIQNVDILTAALNDYQGTIIAISHDAGFLEELRIEKVIDLDAVI